jgi:hypothetical protein
MNWIIVIVSVAIASIIGELYWRKMRKSGHKDLLEIIIEKFSRNRNR